MSNNKMTLHHREAAYFECGEWSVHVQVGDEPVVVRRKGARIDNGAETRDLTSQQASELAAALYAAVQWELNHAPSS